MSSSVKKIKENNFFVNLQSSLFICSNKKYNNQILLKDLKNTNNNNNNEYVTSSTLPLKNMYYNSVSLLNLNKNIQNKIHKRRDSATTQFYKNNNSHLSKCKKKIFACL